MLTTGWDGRARVMYLPAQRMQVQINLLTVEATTECPIRDGLVIGFAGQPVSGPPVRLAVRLYRGALPADVGELLGVPLAATVQQVLAGPDRVRWTRLDLVGVGELTESWAPYRVGVPSLGIDDDATPAGIRAVAGRWADGLWTWLAATDVRSALSGLLARPGQPAFRDTPRDQGGQLEPAAGQWELPAKLAAAVAVEPALAWDLRPGDDGPVLVLRARRTGALPAERLLVGLNEGAARWHPFAPRPEAPDHLVAELDGAEVRQSAGLRFLVRPRPSTEPPAATASDES